MKKALSLFLALLLLTLFTVSCNTQPADSETSNNGTEGAETTAAETDTPPLSIVENGTSQYRVIINDRLSSTLAPSAFKLIDAIKEKTGAELGAATDFEHPSMPENDATDYEILIGTTREGKYFSFDTSDLTELDFRIAVVGTRVLILGGSTPTTLRAVEYFIKNYLPAEPTSDWSLPATTNELKLHSSDSEITVMSLNLLHGYTDHSGKNIYGSEDRVDGENNTVAKRQPRVRELILSYSPDVIGFQEMSNWHSFLESDTALREAGYRLSRCSKNEKISIYYNSQKFTLLESGSIYLTEDPENLPCSVLWNSDGNPRLAHFVRLEVKSTGETFILVNTHIGFENAVLQVNQTRVVGEYCQQLADHYSDPVICTGDFNASYGSEHYTKFTSLGLMGDTRFLATKGSTGTGSFNGFGSSKLGDYAIDQIMVSKNDWYVYTYQVDYTMFGKYLYYSDHYAVVAKIALLPRIE